MVRGSNSVKVQEWAGRLLRFHKADVTVAEFCEGEGVSQPSFYHWKSKLRDQLLPTESPNRRPASSRSLGVFQSLRCGHSSRQVD